MERAYFKSIFLVFIALEAFSLTLEPSFPRIQDKVFLTGEGYKSGEDIIINFEKKLFKTKATQQGTFSTTFFIHLVPGGKKVITAKGKSKLETISFWIKPRIEAYPLAGTRGTIVNVRGEGYSSYERIQVGLGRNSLVAWGTASSLGTFSATFTLSNQPYGTQTLFAVGHSNYLDDRKDFYMMPSLSIVPTRGSIESVVTISGTGFYPSEGPPPGEPVSIDFGTHKVLTTAWTNYYGSFEMPLSVPLCKGGLNNIQGRGGYSGLVCSLNFEIIPRIKQFPQIAYPTRPARLAGDGFFTNETITLTLEKRMEGTRTLTQAGTFLADENGAFSLDFLIDTQPKGVKRVTIRGEFGFCEQRMLEMKPCIEIVELDRKYGTLTLKGGGWMEGEGVSFSFGGPRYIGKTMTDKEGSFLATFKVSGMGEKERVIAEGMKSHELAKAYWEERK